MIRLLFFFFLLPFHLYIFTLLYVQPTTSRRGLFSHTLFTKKTDQNHFFMHLMMLSTLSTHICGVLHVSFGLVAFLHDMVASVHSVEFPSHLFKLLYNFASFHWPFPYSSCGVDHSEKNTRIRICHFVAVNPKWKLFTV